MKFNKIYILGRGAAKRNTKDPESQSNISTGKDLCAEFIRDRLGYSFESSSYFACKYFLFDKLKEEFGYDNIEECYKDRHSEGMRQRWFEEIKLLNKDDETFLSRNIFSVHQIYVGLRSRSELLAAKEEFKDLLCIWVDSSKRCILEGNESCDITEDDCDIVVGNNGSLEEFEVKLDKLVRLLR